MRWRWVCSNGHVSTVGVDLAAQDDRAVEATVERQEDGSVRVTDIREIKR
jgi:hypothetical protein